MTCDESAGIDDAASLLVSQHQARLRPAHLYRLESLVSLVAAPGLGLVRLHQVGIELPLPPPETQASIVAHVAGEMNKLDALRSTTARTIALLKERRATFITAAVTGEIDPTGTPPACRDGVE